MTRKLSWRFKRFLKKPFLFKLEIKKWREKTLKCQSWQKPVAEDSKALDCTVGSLLWSQRRLHLFHLTDKANVNLFPITIHPVLNLVRENCTKSWILGLTFWHSFLYGIDQLKPSAHDWENDTVCCGLVLNFSSARAHSDTNFTATVPSDCLSGPSIFPWLPWEQGNLWDKVLLGLIMAISQLALRKWNRLSSEWRVGIIWRKCENVKLGPDLSALAEFFPDVVESLSCLFFFFVSIPIEIESCECFFPFFWKN